MTSWIVLWLFHAFWFASFSHSGTHIAAEASRLYHTNWGGGAVGRINLIMDRSSWTCDGNGLSWKWEIMASDWWLREVYNAVCYIIWNIKWFTRGCKASFFPPDKMLLIAACSNWFHFRQMQEGMKARLPLLHLAQNTKLCSVLAENKISHTLSM